MLSMEKLIDKFGREINYLRISVTDRCNLRCHYCMPAEGITNKAHSQILSFEQIHRIVSVAVDLGIRKVRITGGEPLVRKDLPLLIEKLKTVSGLKDISLTTNGIHLGNYAVSLRKSGLDRVNISLDSLIPEKFREITRGGELKVVLNSIETVLSVGLTPLKINVVLIKGFNIDEVLSFAILAKLRPIHVRFIEYMPTDLNYFSYEDAFFSCSEAKNICGRLGKLNPVDNKESSTARIFTIDGFSGTIGFISPLSEPFCFSCNKLRLTSDGYLRSCLHSSKTVNIKQAIENKASEIELAGLIKKAVALKPAAHDLLNKPLGLEIDNFSMCQIGG